MSEGRERALPDPAPRAAAASRMKPCVSGKSRYASAVSMSVRFAETTDFEATEDIEVAADSILVDLFGADFCFPPTSAAERAAAPGFTLLASESPRGAVVGFAQVLEIAGTAHLEQLSVHPEHGRRGYGAALLDAAVAEVAKRGYGRISLRTFADVPWNAPFYARHGFRETESETDFERHLVAVEEELGLPGFGRRVLMIRELRPLGLADE